MVAWAGPPVLPTVLWGGAARSPERSSGCGRCLQTASWVLSSGFVGSVFGAWSSRRRAAASVEPKASCCERCRAEGEPLRLSSRRRAAASVEPKASCCERCRGEQNPLMSICLSSLILCSPGVGLVGWWVETMIRFNKLRGVWGGLGPPLGASISSRPVPE